MQPGFKTVAAAIAKKSGIPEDSADRIMTKRERGGGDKKKKNQRMKRVD